MHAAGPSGEQGVDDQIKNEKEKQLEIAISRWEKRGHVVKKQLELLKEAEGLLPKETIESMTKDMLVSNYQSGLHIVDVKIGCAILHLVPQNMTTLDKFWGDFKSGQLSSNFTDCLITDEMRTLAGEDLAVRVIMLEEQYWQWTEYFKGGEMAQTVQKFQSLTVTPGVRATTWETFAEEYLPDDTEQVKTLLDSAWRDPVVELVVLIPFFWPHIITYWLERNHTFPQTLTELLQYSLCNHFGRQTGSNLEQEHVSLSEKITESLILLGSNGLDSIVQGNCREIDLNADERKGFDSAVFGLVTLTETKRYTFVNTFLHDYCVALYIKNALDRMTDMAVLNQLVQNAGRMPLVCFFVSGLLSDRGGDFLSALANSGVFNSPFERVETSLIALAETNHVQNLYPCIESIFDGSVLDVSSESVLSLLFTSAAIKFINQSNVVQSVRLCDRSKLKKEESMIFRELEDEPDKESVSLFSNLWSDVSDRKFILLLLQCIPLLFAVKKAGSKLKGPLRCKISFKKLWIRMFPSGTINSTQMLQLTQAMKLMVSLTYLELSHWNYVQGDLVGHISPSTKYSSTSKLTTSATTMLMPSLTCLPCLQDLELNKCNFVTATELEAMCDRIKGSWQLTKLNITVLQAEWNDAMGVAIGKLFLKLPSLMELEIGKDYHEQGKALSHAVKHFNALRKLQRLRLRVKMSDVGTKQALARSLHHLECLKDLDLSYNELSNDGCILITEAFHKMSSIERLTLRYNNISVSGAKSFPAHVGYLTCLKHLDLGYNKLSDDGCIAIAEGFHCMRSLERLGLSSNGISDRGGTVLMGKISFLPRVHWIDLHGNKMTDAVAQLVVDTVKRMESRIHVNVSSNRFSSKGVKILKQCHGVDSSHQNIHVHEPIRHTLMQTSISSSNFVSSSQSIPPHKESSYKRSAQYSQSDDPLETSTPELFHKGTEGQTNRNIADSRYEMSAVRSDIDPEGDESMKEKAEVVETSKEREMSGTKPKEAGKSKCNVM
ncbi:uncharacterized protein LOC118430310 [Branchiostoma floridae]|uniref:Uncharacterized protein LOC118430310 n=2 Tax=Branchiostoma floridae TaxID=7739 RepID=A0A9J7MAB5_BRAFL|nr:uncharacterized protein LOC118430310 [Branchiostoma floridae]